ncbi:hypothetical protein [Treponema sp.]|uniref:hypothetical protein n=1 Tax=Treponema sp. TaxID=166 RepID=UPI0025EBEFD1|nr:hypothetical protein [Treponema sp.]MCR5218723.1 hypothetical protein [Treponema sp.]
MNNISIKDFVEKRTVAALDSLLATDDITDIIKASVILADFFGAGTAFKNIADNKDDSEEKLISSFHNNLVLLIQKTWVEKSDETLKAQVLYQLEEFCKQITDKTYAEAYPQFFSILNDVVYLMFGTQTKSPDFAEYALRIDPEFGIFWWYIQSLPKDAAWSQDKSRIAILLGMYFLANY